MDNGMENRSKTVAIVIALLLVVVLVWFLFIRDSGDETTTEPPASTPDAQVVEIDEGQDGAADEGDDGSDDGAADEGDDMMDDEDSETPPGQDAPVVGDGEGDDGEEVTLPEGWEDFTLAEKIAANPYGCDLDRYPNSMWPDGTCHPPAEADEGDDMDEDDANDMMNEDGMMDENGSDEAGQS